MYISTTPSLQMLLPTFLSVLYFRLNNVLDVPNVHFFYYRWCSVRLLKPQAQRIEADVC